MKVFAVVVKNQMKVQGIKSSAHPAHKQTAEDLWLCNKRCEKLIDFIRQQIFFFLLLLFSRLLLLFLVNNNLVFWESRGIQ